MTSLCVSIAMCTYNGAANVLTQLQSFAAQTKLPNELIVCDDASSDATAKIVQNFAAVSPFSVKLFVNEKNLGFAGNFAHALSKCSGDLIFLSDQDDVWLPTKLEKFVDVFSKDAGVGVAFCDAFLVDDQLNSLRKTWWQSRHFEKRHQNQLTGVNGAALILKDPTWIAAGATMAFRATYRGLVEPIPAGWTHDAWIATIVSACTRVALIAEPLNQYRQHAAQVYGAAVPSGTSMRQAFVRNGSTVHFQSTVNRYQQLQDRLRGLKITSFSGAVEGKLAHWRSRLEMRQCSWLRQNFLIAQELVLFRYHRYSQGWKSFAMDLLAAVAPLGFHR